MALRVSMTNGISNTAATWNEVVYNSGMHNSTEVAFPSTEGAAAVSDVFTAPDLTSQCLGAICWLSDNASAQDVTIHARLQEYDGVSAWVDKGTQIDITKANDATSNDHYHLAFNGFNYTWATLTAGYYRVKYWKTAGGSNHDYRATPAGGVVVATIVIGDNATAVPVSGDTVIIASTVTQNADHTWGDGVVTNFELNTSGAFGGFACAVVRGGILQPETGNDRILSINGIIRCVDTGKIKAGTDTVRYEDNWTFRYVLATDDVVFFYRHYGGQVELYGDDRTHGTEREAFITSGTGTAVDPLIISEARTSWAVDDEIVFEPEANNEHEVKYIRTVVSSTSFTLAATPGGAESALTNERTSGLTLAINCHSNIIFESTGGDASVDFESAICEDAGTPIMSNIKIDSLFNDAKSDAAFYIESGSLSMEFDHIYIKNPEQIGISVQSNSVIIDHFVGYENNTTGNTEGLVNTYCSSSIFSDVRLIGS